MLEQQIQNDLKAAMLAKDKVALASIRGIKAAILLAKTADGSQKETLEDAELVKIIQKLVKQRKESQKLHARFIIKNVSELPAINSVKNSSCLLGIH